MAGDEDSAYILTSHAREMLEQRGIPLEWVMRTLASPASVAPDANDPTLEHALARIPEFDGRVLRVVYNPGVNPRTIVTCYFDRRQRKRL